MNDSSVFYGNSFLGDTREGGPFKFGRVDICIDHEYVTVCDNSWHNLAASVVCSQLGFSRYGTHNYYYSYGMQSLDILNLVMLLEKLLSPLGVIIV